MSIPRQLRDLYRFAGFEPQDRIVIDDRVVEGVVITLQRRPQKGIVVFADSSPGNTTIPAGGACAICRAATVRSPCTFHSFASFVIGVAA